MINFGVKKYKREHPHVPKSVIRDLKEAAWAQQREKEQAEEAERVKKFLKKKGSRGAL
jgi:hypothetical protein